MTEKHLTRRIFGFGFSLPSSPALACAGPQRLPPPPSRGCLMSLLAPNPPPLLRSAYPLLGAASPAKEVFHYYYCTQDIPLWEVEFETQMKWETLLRQGEEQDDSREKETEVQISSSVTILTEYRENFSFVFIDLLRWFCFLWNEICLGLGVCFLLHVVRFLHIWLWVRV